MTTQAFASAPNRRSAGLIVYAETLAILNHQVAKPSKVNLPGPLALALTHQIIEEL